MKIVISGSSGLIGKALLKYLRGKGHEVYRLVRHMPEKDDEIGWDIAAGKLDMPKLEDFDAFIHLGGVPVAARWSDKYKDEILQSRVQSTALMAEAIKYLQNPPKVWLNASAIGFYGNCGEKPVDEDSAAGNTYLSHVAIGWEKACDLTYTDEEIAQREEHHSEGNSQQSEESEAHMLSPQDNMSDEEFAEHEEGLCVRVVNMRIGVVLSTNGGALARMLPPFKLGLGGVIGDGKQYMSWIHIDDLVAAIAYALQNEQISGPLNLTAPNPVKNSEFTASMSKALKRPAIIPMPAFGAKLAFGEMADEILLASANVLPKKLLDSGFLFQYETIDEALSNLLSN